MLNRARTLTTIPDTHQLVIMMGFGDQLMARMFLTGVEAKLTGRIAPVSNYFLFTDQCLLWKCLEKLLKMVYTR